MCVKVEDGRGGMQRKRREIVTDSRRGGGVAGQDWTGQSISAREGPSVKRQWGDSEERHCRWR
jgi:hypothetical protein